MPERVTARWEVVTREREKGVLSVWLMVSLPGVEVPVKEVTKVQLEGRAWDRFGFKTFGDFLYRVIVLSNVRVKGDGDFFFWRLTLQIPR